MEGIERFPPPLGWRSRPRPSPGKEPHRGARLPHHGAGRVQLRRFASAWLAVSGTTSGALFRATTRHGVVGERLSDRRVDAIVKRATRHARLEGHYSAHSLRSGLVTTLGQRGRTEVETMRVSRHKSSAMVRLYTRESDAKASSPLRGAW